jgi:FHS family glucose/mannose:H+ symporter-like MFS transporter
MKPVQIASERENQLTRYLIVAVGATCLAVLALCYGLLGPALPLLADSFAVDLSRQGSLMTLYFAGFLLATLFGGSIAEFWGKGRSLALAMAAITCGMLAVATSQNYTWALFGMLVFGLGGGGVEMLASAVASDALPDRRGATLNFLQTMFILAALSPMLVTWFASEAEGWRLPFVALGCCALLLTVALLKLRERMLPAPTRTDLQIVDTLLRQPRLWALAVCLGLYVFSEVGLYSWAVDYLQSAHEAPANYARGALSLFWITVTTGRIACVFWADRVGLKQLLVFLSLGAVIGMVIVLVTPFSGWKWALLGLTGLFYSGLYGTVLACAGDECPQYPGTVFGLVMAAGALGAMAGPWAVGTLAEATSIESAFWLVPLAMAGITFVAIGLDRSRNGALS